MSENENISLMEYIERDGVKWVAMFDGTRVSEEDVRHKIEFIWEPTENIILATKEQYINVFLGGNRDQYNELFD